MYSISDLMTLAVLMASVGFLVGAYLFWELGARSQFKQDSELISAAEQRAIELEEEVHILEANGGRRPAAFQLFDQEDYDDHE
ncbi:hypothetical protein SEA_UNPHAZED_30 [Microbacterium phage Unphazed]|uniref:Membrane protein n=5 Tax=Tinytimothyvirus alex44 TaxID=2845588 RepID=A0A7G9A0G3_9CAUD|nr:hypothetical protein SEA_ARMAWEN_29 [Microbacterium phage ArMaWen]QDF16058.1 hypothetical protein SEA_LILYLOU_30 [Microbacterium phage LilyLou]QJD52774.1 hypothetical protein SEA_UNPHAZED_30 [Microbacterium phage Unphazed]QJD52828.1 hypothetical protein SEA_PHOGO_30 [Microbacterium phage Phogo]QNL30102.1 membrane protein [Microbacterium phage Stormbreaker]UTN92894.1 membrane protein [Microbacterium phage Birdfeeder]UVK60420.1 hypothetical protein SEA_CORN21_29 [Microbacterium phage Corn21]